MILGNAKLVDNGELVDISIAGERIGDVSAVDVTNDNDFRLPFNNVIAFPGLINSHDHLDFNLFPKLGDKIYNNYTEWGLFIHREFKREIAEVMAVPKQLRINWGLYKNLLGGVTTVVNHGEDLQVENNLITVHEKTQDLHSVGFEKYWNIKLNNPFKAKMPVAIHTGEGTDDIAEREIDSLINWNKSGRQLIGIHAVAMTKNQAQFFKAIVWCPESNYFLLNKTASIEKLAPFTNIIFGTDSTLTSGWNIWEHIAGARKSRMLTDEGLYHSLNKTAATVWGMNAGKIAKECYADLVIAKTNGITNVTDAFFNVQPADIQLVIHRGNIRLFDQQVLSALIRP
ncbi:MAG TPA: hypothetical protein VIM77_08285, partial [Mucilaginibacter sp.]